MKNDIFSQLDAELAHTGEKSMRNGPPSEASIHLHISVPLKGGLQYEV